MVWLGSSSPLHLKCSGLMHPTLFSSSFPALLCSPAAWLMPTLLRPSQPGVARVTQTCCARVLLLWQRCPTAGEALGLPRLLQHHFPLHFWVVAELFPWV